MNNEDLLLESYDYDLPKDLIASRPKKNRSDSKLLVYHQTEDKITHAMFSELPSFLSQENLIVLNETKVFPCRLVGQKSTGGKAEIFILSLVSTKQGFECLIKSRGKKQIGDEFTVSNIRLKVTEILESTFRVSPNINDDMFFTFLEKEAFVPIPPYIRDGVADEQDKQDYQTIYAKHSGSVAAPTAGLHFSDRLFESLSQKNIDKAFVTLHVGIGTFKPVQTENIEDHKMHSESFFIASENLKKINSGKKIIAVGTTSLRVLESCFTNNKFNFNSDKTETDIFLYPGKEIHSISGLITNFHLPKSSLLMLVSSLIGRKKTLELYQVAIKNNYRFFSYGDAMLILR